MSFADFVNTEINNTVQKFCEVLAEKYNLNSQEIYKFWSEKSKSPKNQSRLKNQSLLKNQSHQKNQVIKNY